MCIKLSVVKLLGTEPRNNRTDCWSWIWAYDCFLIDRRQFIFKNNWEKNNPISKRFRAERNMATVAHATKGQRISIILYSWAWKQELTFSSTVLFPKCNANYSIKHTSSFTAPTSNEAREEFDISDNLYEAFGPFSNFQNIILLSKKIELYNSICNKFNVKM